MRRVAHNNDRLNTLCSFQLAILRNKPLIQQQTRRLNNSKGLRTLDWEVLELIVLLQDWGSLLVLGGSLSLLSWLLCWGLRGCHGARKVEV